MTWLAILLPLASASPEPDATMVVRRYGEPLSVDRAVSPDFDHQWPPDIQPFAVFTRSYEAMTSRCQGERFEAGDDQSSVSFGARPGRFSRSSTRAGTHVVLGISYLPPEGEVAAPVLDELKVKVAGRQVPVSLDGLPHFANPRPCSSNLITSREGPERVALRLRGGSSGGSYRVLLVFGPKGITEAWHEQHLGQPWSPICRDPTSFPDGRCEPLHELSPASPTGIEAALIQYDSWCGRRFERVYDEAHLEAVPEQRVARIAIVTSLKPDPYACRVRIITNARDHSASMDIEGVLSGGGKVEGEGWSATIQEQQHNGRRALLLKWSSRAALEVGPGRAVVLEPGSADDGFRLYQDLD